jgi:hypothetical protein
MSKILNETVAKITGAVDKNGNLSQDIVIYESAVKLPVLGKDWHPLFSIGKNPKLAEVKPHERVGGNNWLIGSFFFLYGKEYDTKVRGREVKSPAVVYISRSVLPPIQKDMFDAPEVGDFMREYNGKARSAEKTIGVLTKANQDKDDIISFILSQTSLNSSSMKRVANALGQSDDEFRDALEEYRGKGKRRKIIEGLKSLWAVIKRRKWIIIIAVVAVLVYFVGRGNLWA